MNEAIDLKQPEQDAEAKAAAAKAADYEFGWHSRASHDGRKEHRLPAA